jgi:hypothetical protein
MTHMRRSSVKPERSITFEHSLVDRHPGFRGRCFLPGETSSPNSHAAEQVCQGPTHTDKDADTVTEVVNLPTVALDVAPARIQFR